MKKMKSCFDMGKRRNYSEIYLVDISVTILKIGKYYNWLKLKFIGLVRLFLSLNSLIHKLE